MEDKDKIKQTANLDQGFATLADSLPPYIRRMYENFIANGFGEGQAVQLCCSWLHGNAGGRLN